MDYRQKFKVLKALDPSIGIGLDANDKFYVGSRLEVKCGKFLKGIVGWGDTPQDAIEATWANIEGQLIIKDAMNDGRQVYRWNDCMWELVAEEED